MGSLEQAAGSGKPFSWRTGYRVCLGQTFFFSLWEVEEIEKQVETLTQMFINPDIHSHSQ